MPKNDFAGKWKILTTLQNLPKNMCNLGKIIVASGFEKLPKVPYIAQSGHTVHGQPAWTRSFYLLIRSRLGVAPSTPQVKPNSPSLPSRAASSPSSSSWLERPSTCSWRPRTRARPRRRTRSTWPWGRRQIIAPRGQRTQIVAVKG